MSASYPHHPTPEIPDHEMIRQIGRGSYGEVWLAQNVMGQFRAVKVVYRDRFESDRPYEREFSGIKKFEPVSRRHESQLDLLHVGRNGDYFYYVMELADDVTNGQEIDSEHYAPRTLKHELLQRGRLPFAECLEIALSLATALKHLHGSKLVHRDVKPSNVIFINGRPKLADIGLVADIDATLSYVGTEGYLPPEGPGQATADIYSFGKVLYEISTGNDRKDFPEIPTTLLDSRELDRLSELNEVIVKAGEANVHKRYQSADDILEDLVLLQSEKSVITRRKLERRLRWFRRAAVVAIVFGSLAWVGYLYQKEQTEIADQLAQNLEKKTEELGLAKEGAIKSAQEAKQAASALFDAEAVTFMQEGDYQSAALSTVSALNWARAESEQSDVLKLRLSILMDELPEVVGYYQESMIGSGFAPRLIYSGKSETVIFDTLTSSHVATLKSTRNIPFGNRLMFDRSMFWIFQSENELATIDLYTGDLISTVSKTRGPVYSVGESNLLVWDLTNRVLIKKNGITGEPHWTAEFQEQPQLFGRNREGSILFFTSAKGAHNSPHEWRLIDGNSGNVIDKTVGTRLTFAMFGYDDEFLVAGESHPYSKNLSDTYIVPILPMGFGQPRRIDMDGVTTGIENQHWRPLLPPPQSHRWVPMFSGNQIVLFNPYAEDDSRSLPPVSGEIVGHTFTSDERYLIVVTSRQLVFGIDLLDQQEWKRLVLPAGLSRGLLHAVWPGNRLNQNQSGPDGDTYLLDIKKLLTNPALSGRNRKVSPTSSSSAFWKKDFPHVFYFVNTSNRLVSLNVSTGETTDLIRFGSSPTSFAPNYDQTLLATLDSEDGVSIWTLATGELINRFPYEDYPVNELKWSPTTNVLAGISQVTGALWTFAQINSDFEAQERIIKSIPPHPDIVIGGRKIPPPRFNIPSYNAIDWHPNGNQLFVSTTNMGTVTPSPQTWDNVFEVQRSQHRTVSLFDAGKFSPNGLLLLSSFNGNSGGHGRSVALHERTQSDESTLPIWPKATLNISHPAQVSDIEWAKSGSMFLTVINSLHRERAGYLWDTDAVLAQKASNPNSHDSILAESSKHILEHGGVISCAAFSKNEKLLATGDLNGNLVLWSTENGMKVLSLETSNDKIATVSFSPDDEILVWITESGRLHHCSLTIDDESVLRAKLELLSGGLPGNDGKLVEKDRNALDELFQQLRTTPEYSRESRTADLIEWHAAELYSGLHFTNTFAPRFHVEQLIKHQPDEPKWKKIEKDLNAKQNTQLELAE